MSLRRPAKDQPETFEFNSSSLDAAKTIVSKYPTDKQQSAVMALLYIAQKQNNNWIPLAAMKYIAKFLEMPYIKVYEVATFYTMYNLSPVGNYFVQVCTTTPHVPEGATPKDGPSAGIGMVTSIVSSITGIPVRRDVAMTGEVTLTGQVLPIGGLKEKLLAAHRAGIKEVLIPKENEKDLVDMPKKIIDDINITPVEYADQVLKVALTKELKRTEWVEVDISKKDDKSQASIQ